MPNQYTKFQSSLQQSEPVQYRWRNYNTSAKKPRPRRKKLPVADTSPQNGWSPSVASAPSLHTDSDSLPSPSPELMLYLPSGGLRVDPFRAYPISPDHEELTVLDYFLHILSPSARQIRTASCPTDPHISLLLPYVMQEPPLFDALLATCQASIALSSGLSAFDDPFFVKHRGRAMSRLRQKLESNIDNSALLSVAMLLTCDYLVGDTTAVAGHAKAMQRMVDMRGRLPDETQWDKFVKRGVDAYKYIGYISTGQWPENSTDMFLGPLDTIVNPSESLSYPLPPFSSAQCEKWSTLPSGFSELVLTCNISSQLSAIICEMNIMSKEDCKDFQKALHTSAVIQAALQRFNQHREATYLERCIAAGLLAFTFQFPRLQVSNMFHDPPLQGMVRLFSVPHQPTSIVEKNVMIWSQMCIEGFMSTRPIRLPRSQDMFMKLFKRESIACDWPTIEPILTCFFTTPDILERWRMAHEVFLQSYAKQINAPETDSTDSSWNDSFIHRGPLNCHTDDDIASGICPISGRSSAAVDGQQVGCPIRPRRRTCL